MPPHQRKFNIQFSKADYYYLLHSSLLQCFLQQMSNNLQVLNSKWIKKYYLGGRDIDVKPERLCLRELSRRHSFSRQKHQHEQSLVILISKYEVCQSRGQQTDFYPLPVFANQFLEQSHTHFIYYPWLFLCTRQNQVTRTVRKRPTPWLTKPKIFTIWSFI